MGTEQKKRCQYPKRNEKLGIGKKKRRQYPKGKEKMGIEQKKCIMFHESASFCKLEARIPIQAVKIILLGDVQKKKIRYA
ncbi:unknown [Clostridium sp. CAG:510]|nr:unknown [Clostridium sp. CAG:510]